MGEREESEGRESGFLEEENMCVKSREFQERQLCRELSLSSSVFCFLIFVFSF